MALHLNKHESPSPKDALCQVWLKLAQWFLRIRWKYKKFTDRWTDGGTTDTRQSAEKLTWAFSLGELKTKPGVVLPGQGDSGLWFSRGPTSKHGTTSYSGCGSLIGEETQCWLRPSWKMSTSSPQMFTHFAIHKLLYTRKYSPKSYSHPFAPITSGLIVNWAIFFFFNVIE